MSSFYDWQGSRATPCLLHHFDEVFDQGRIVVPGPDADQVAIDDAIAIDVDAAELRDIEGALGPRGQGAAPKHAGRRGDLDAVTDHRHRLVRLEKVARDAQQVL